MNLSVKIKDVVFANPIWVASGTFGYGEEFIDFVDLANIGAIVTKTVTLNARVGNPPPRIVETSSGLLNSIGLENPGASKFREQYYPRLQQLNTKVIVSIAGSNEDEFAECLTILQADNFPHAFEINLSCPNITHSFNSKGEGYKLFAQNAQVVKRITQQLKKITKIPIIIKLTPNVTDLVEIAKAAEESSADAVSLVNTYFAMAVNAETMRPQLGNIIGGLSGPAIKPMALRAVWDVHKHLTIPIIGIGGIMNANDVAEFILCGATAVQIGTANFINPNVTEQIGHDFIQYLKRKKINNLENLRGKLQV